MAGTLGVRDSWVLGHSQRIPNPRRSPPRMRIRADQKCETRTKYNAAEEGFRIDNTPPWGRFLRPAGDPLLFRTSNPRCRHAWPEVRPDHRPEPRGPSRDRALAALDHRPRWADPSRPCSSLARSGKDLEGV